MMKDKKFYKTVGEVAREISVNAHTLRFWEKQFRQIRPTILSGQRRYYSEKDINVLRLIYELLKNQGYTISGAKKLLNKSSIKLDAELTSGIKNSNLKSSLKIKANKIKLILQRMKGSR